MAKKNLDALELVRELAFESDVLQERLSDQRKVALAFIEEHYPEHYSDGKEFSHKGGVFSVTTRQTYDCSEAEDTALGKKLLAKRAKKEQVSAALSQLNRDIYDMEREMAKKYPAKVKSTTAHILHVTRKTAQKEK
jgi:hypothetical protein